MKGIELLDLMGGIDAGFVEAAGAEPSDSFRQTLSLKKGRIPRVLAACAAVCVLAAFLAMIAVPALRGAKPAELPPFAEDPASRPGTSPADGPEQNPGIGTETEDPGTAAEDPGTDPASQGPAVGGGMFLFDREYLDITYDISYLEHLCDGEAEIVDPGRGAEWVSEVFLKKTPEEQNALPTMVQAVRELGIAKEDLIRLNESRKPLGDDMILEDWYIDALYLDDGDMIKALMHPLSRLYGGKVYTWNAVSRMTEEERAAIGLDPAAMREYAREIAAYCLDNRLADGLTLSAVLGEYWPYADGTASVEEEP